MTTHYPSPSRSSTVEPPEPRDDETKYYNALLHDGCRPLFPISLLPRVEKDPDAYRDLLRPWTRYPDTSNPEDWQVFSRQYDRWKEFRKWQLHSRRQTPSFSIYLEEYRRESEMHGAATEQTNRPEFERTARVRWQREYNYHPSQLDDSPEAVLSRHAEAATTLLVDQGFDEPFQLRVDSKQQDQWTTYVEYLAFECFWLQSFEQSARRLQKNPNRARKYDTVRAEANHLQYRVAWIRSEICKIEAELEVTRKTGGSSLGRSRKRKPADDGVYGDAAQPPVVKRRRAYEPESLVAGSSDNPQTTRSKRRKFSGDDAELKSKAEVADKSNNPTVGGRKRRRGIHEKKGSAAPGTALQSGLEAVAVSVATTDSRSRHERLKTLRPRVGGKVVMKPGGREPS